jgi:hypothetical protein
MPPNDYGPIHVDPRLRALGDICDGLGEIVRLGIKAAHKVYKARTRRSRGGTLRPGTDTPLWNAVAAEARRLTRPYGSKAKLGRHLGLPRQRIHEYIKANSAAPDAERALELLLWIGRNRSFEGRLDSIRRKLSRIT